MRSSKPWIFIEPVNGGACFLIIKADGKPVVRHLKCRAMADVIVELDAFYCMKCRYSGRVSGRWVAEIVTAWAGCAGDSGAGPGT